MRTNAGELLRSDALRSTSTPVWSTARIFVLALVLQLFHLLEHVVQVAQGKFLGIKPAHGILGSLSPEPCREIAQNRVGRRRWRAWNNRRIFTRRQRAKALSLRARSPCITAS